MEARLRAKFNLQVHRVKREARGDVISRKCLVIWWHWPFKFATIIKSSIGQSLLLVVMDFLCEQDATQRRQCNKILWSWWWWCQGPGNRSSTPLAAATPRPGWSKVVNLVREYTAATSKDYFCRSPQHHHRVQDDQRPLSLWWHGSVSQPTCNWNGPKSFNCCFFARSQAYNCCLFSPPPIEELKQFRCHFGLMQHLGSANFQLKFAGSTCWSCVFQRLIQQSCIWEKGVGIPKYFLWRWFQFQPRI